MFSVVSGTLTTRTVPQPASTRSAANPECPTVTRTATVCRRCVTPECAVLSTKTRRCDCPWPPASVTVAWPCGTDGKCAGVKGLGCTTSYRWARPTSACPANLDPPNKPRPKPVQPGGGMGCTAPPQPTVTSPPTTTTTTTTAAPTVTPALCSTEVTVQEYPQSCSCVSDFCIRDNLVTLPCGCSRLDIATATSTLACPTNSSCTRCFTAFPFTETQPCSSGSLALARTC
ncbi:uncharacterized protein PpBr36_06609 [Pyricularia pennisetigena]|uniref:uncharacterized protein n=1 Tax=Pyricularia pennisetigena TaxID=1578925 RepID=UPI00114F9DD5|nr:uncharacterized protein PpBr36_06609 [Pyricularia pennisetigena]TLS23693.1 hypothetical protein PpBr36_06609 [Pyricularia pennisetigena]